MVHQPLAMALLKPTFAFGDNCAREKRKEKTVVAEYCRRGDAIHCNTHLHQIILQDSVVGYTVEYDCLMTATGHYEPAFVG